MAISTGVPGQGLRPGQRTPATGTPLRRLRPNEIWHIDIKGPFFINLADDLARGSFAGYK